MTYDEALRWIYGFADLERGVGHAGRAAYAAGPARTRRLLGALGNPHQRLTCAHVGGSKGKGSVCAWSRPRRRRRACAPAPTRSRICTRSASGSRSTAGPSSRRPSPTSVNG